MKRLDAYHCKYACWILLHSNILVYIFKLIPTSKGNKQTRKQNISKSNHIIATPRIRRTGKSQKHRNCFTACLVTTGNLEKKTYNYKTPVFFGVTIREKKHREHLEKKLKKFGSSLRMKKKTIKRQISNKIAKKWKEKKD